MILLLLLEEIILHISIILRPFVEFSRVYCLNVNFIMLRLSLVRERTVILSLTLLTLLDTNYGKAIINS